MDDLVTLFSAIGLSSEKARETASNSKLASTLKDVLEYAGIKPGSITAGRLPGPLYYYLATTLNKSLSSFLPFLAQEIAKERLKTNDQISAAMKYLEKNPVLEHLDKARYEQACGIGIEVTENEVKDIIKELIIIHSEKLGNERYHALGFFLGEVRNTKLRWANPVIMKTEVDRALLEFLGPKDDRDDPKLIKKLKKKGTLNDLPESTSSMTCVTDEKIDSEAMLRNMFLEGEMSKLHRAGENPQTSPALMEEHLKATKGKIITRFPPEPNGFLHIGHAKAINIDFGYAQIHDGHCILRYDDTNPDAEEQRYFDSIVESVHWLGFTPYKITYSSDYFQKLYDLAVQLIKEDKAYVCYCSPEQINDQRGGENHEGPRYECEHRNRPIQASLLDFEHMRAGRFREGEAILRMKMDMQSGNPQFWDLAAYRVKYTPHYRTASHWCIYPTYDYTHCLVDSMENITHSLCTLEFRQSRESYYWLVDALRLYKPVQWESGRLNITNTVLSKRKLSELVSKGIVKSWDDPRLYTLVALRRRGCPPEAINAFVRSVGVTTTNSTIDSTRLDYFLRAFLNISSPRIMAVLEPITLIIDNLPEEHLEYLPIPNHPKDPTKGTRQVPFSKKILIEKDDFRADSVKGFLRLTPDQPIGLLHVPFPLSYISHRTTDTSGLEIHVHYHQDSPPKSKPKAYIHWIAQAKGDDAPVPIEARNYSSLFFHANPSDKIQVPNGWLSDINPESLHLCHGYVDVGLKLILTKRRAGFKVHSTSSSNSGSHKEATDLQLQFVEPIKFQFVRLGYYCLDPDSNLISSDPKTWSVIFNRTVGLKEDANKNIDLK